MRYDNDSTGRRTGCPAWSEIGLREFIVTNSQEKRVELNEPVLDPTLPICDPHHHLWLHKGIYSLKELLHDTGAGHNIVSTVFVACEAQYRQTGPDELKPVGETEFVESIAQENVKAGGKTAVAAGIVGFADLMLGTRVAPILEAHLAASPTRFRGIRHTVTWDPSPLIRTSAPYPRGGVMLESNFQAGIACLGKYGLSFDAWLFHPQIPELTALAEKFPDVPMILNHIGLPLGIGPYEGQRAAVFETWKRSMAEAAKRPNVYVKLGGLAMPRSGFGWHELAAPLSSEALAQAMRPYFIFCIDTFGPERCMFESNFPVDGIAYSYRTLWNAFKRVVADYSQGDRHALFLETANRVYRLA